ncbi:MAG: cation diffusion facilitator family transporter [Acidithiobacillales bacterium]
MPAISTSGETGADASAGTVVLGLLGNVAITVAKLVAFVFSGSGAMFAESLHSAADSVNTMFLWIGVRLSCRPADLRHPYGYGAERYFWSFASAIGVLFLGGGATIYHGIQELTRPEPIRIGALTWAALGAGALLDGGVFIVSIRQAARRRAERSWLDYVRQSTDSSLLAVLFENGVAMLGLLVAAFGIGLTVMRDAAVYDAVASIAIGILMSASALVLAQRNRLLLLGEAVRPDIERRIRQIVLSDPAVGRLLSIRTRILAADEYRVDLQVDLSPDAVVDRLRPEIRLAADRIHSADDLEAFARTFARRVVDELAGEIDRLEKRIRKEVPGARVIDVEAD